MMRAIITNEFFLEGQSPLCYSKDNFTCFLLNVPWSLSNNTYKVIIEKERLFLVATCDYEHQYGKEYTPSSVLSKFKVWYGNADIRSDVLLDSFIYDGAVCHLTKPSHFSNEYKRLEAQNKRYELYDWLENDLYLI